MLAGGSGGTVKRGGSLGQGTSHDLSHCHPTPAYLIVKYLCFSQEIPETDTFFICQPKETSALQCPFLYPVMQKTQLLGLRAYSLAGVRAAAKLCSKNRNHFLPRQQQNSLEQWFSTSVASQKYPGSFSKSPCPGFTPDQGNQTPLLWDPSIDIF